jgi:hypothetical protein
MQWYKRLNNYSMLTRNNIIISYYNLLLTIKQCIYINIFCSRFNLLLNLLLLTLRSALSKLRVNILLYIQLYSYF